MDNNEWMELTGAFSAYRGYRAYQATGDVRTGMRVGSDTYGAIWLMGMGLSGCLVCILFALVVPGALLGLLLFGPLTWLGVHLYRKYTGTYRAITSGAIHRVPPPVPGAAIPPAQEYVYGYDLATGTYTRKPKGPASTAAAQWTESARRDRTTYSDLMRLPKAE